VTIARLLWLCQNACFFGKEVSSPNQLVQFAQAMMANYKSVNMGETQSPTNTAETTKRWKALEQGCLKLNWDAELGSSPSRMGVGAMLRDEQGRVRVAMATAMVIPNFIVVEVVALWKAVNFCLDLGYKRVIFEGDSMQVVQSMNQEQPWGRYAQLLDDVRAQLLDDVHT
jgi:hypothetical protein